MNNPEDRLLRQRLARAASRHTPAPSPENCTDVGDVTHLSTMAAHVLEGADVVALEAAIAGVKAFTSQHSGHVALEQEVVNMETRLALIAQREALNTAAAQLLAQCLAEQQGNPMVLKAAREEELLQLLSRAAELELVSEKIAAAKSFLERVTHERQLEVKRKERLMESLQGRMGYLCNVINSKNDDGSVLMVSCLESAKEDFALLQTTSYELQQALETLPSDAFPEARKMAGEVEVILQRYTNTQKAVDTWTVLMQPLSDASATQLVRASRE
ncbi:hypothetical protein CYMTET_30101 [Cymbomonas tetramitiformis]|uniref:Uncharacterized protein n=1 Tax=Cymbomonas tetramitiformis TaxID=36881 RepID=A0AAE0FK46_9CHLO|nr:hypothetical protein CYMTET_30101 [Cymbomonas tetramitiformis]